MEFRIDGDIADSVEEAALLEKCEEFARLILAEHEGMHYTFNGHHVGTHDMRSEDIASGQRRTMRAGDRQGARA